PPDHEGGRPAFWGVRAWLPQRQAVIRVPGRRARACIARGVARRPELQPSAQAPKLDRKCDVESGVDLSLDVRASVRDLLSHDAADDVLRLVAQHDDLLVWLDGWVRGTAPLEM